MSKNDLTKNTLLLSIGTILNKGLLFIMIPFFSSWLSTEEYGIFDLLSTYIALLIPVVTLSTSNSVFRSSIDASDEDKKKYITNGFFLYVINITLLSFILIVVRILFGWKLAIPFTFLAIGEIFNNYFQGYMRGIKKLNIYSFCMAIDTLIIAIFSTIFIKIFGMGLYGLIYGYTIGFMLGNLLIIIITKYWNYFDIKSFSIKIIKEMVRYSFPLVFNDISWWVVNVSDRSIIKIFLGASVNGIYAIANKIPALCTSIFGTFNISWQQTASELVDTKERNDYFNKVYNKSTAILMSLCIGILSLNFILFDFIFDTKYNIARFHAPILLFSILFNSISQFIGGIQISFKRPKENGVTTVIAAIINIVTHLLLIRIIGLYAASISTLISNLSLMVLRKIRLKEVPLHLEKNNYFYFLIFIYVFICQYIFTNNYIINILNVGLASIIFLIINYGMIKNISMKLLKIKKKSF